MHIGSSTAQPTLFSAIQQIAGIAPTKRPDNKPAVSGHGDEDQADSKTASGGQTGTVQTGTSKASTQRGSVVNLLV